MVSRYLIKTLILSLILGNFSSPISVLAASDGSLGNPSNGTSTVSLEIQSYFKITGMATRNFGTWTGIGTLTSDDDVCVYTNVPSGTYRVTVTGNGTAGAFTMASGGNTLAYEAWWNDQAGTSGLVQVTTATALTGQTGANTSDQACSGGNTGSLRIVIPSTNLAAVPSGTYTGTVSVQIEAN